MSEIKTYVVIEPSIEFLEAIMDIKRTIKRITTSLEKIMEHPGGRQALYSIQQFIRNAYAARISGNTYDMAQYPEEFIDRVLATHISNSDVDEIAQLYIHNLYKTAVGHPDNPTLESSNPCIYCSMRLGNSCEPIWQVSFSCGHTAKIPAYACIMCRVAKATTLGPCDECKTN